MSEHRGREVSKLKGPELYLDLFTFLVETPATAATSLTPASS